jgi:hypothetical protein
MKIFDMKTSFAAGELSPLLHARVDLAQYANGAAYLNNFIILPQGGLSKRPGTVSLGEKAYADVRLVPFVFSEEDSCVLAFGDGFVDRYTYTGYRERILGSPYTSSHLARLRWLQSADVLYLFHPDVPIHMLRRETGGWRFEKVELEKGPFEDANTDEEKKLSFTELADFKYDLHANFPLFLTYDLLEALIKVEVKIKGWSDTFELKNGGTNPGGGLNWGTPVVVRNVFGAFSYRTTGKWTGTVKVERCLPEGWIGKDEADWVWEEFKEHFSNGGAEENFAFSGVVEEYATHFRFSYAGPKNRVIVAFDYEGGLIERVLRVKEIISQQQATVEDVEKKGGYIPETDAWAIGAFGPHYGYPSIGIFHQERLVLAATRHSPQTLWMSQPASWHDFSTSIPAKDSDSITVTLASKEVNAIRGLASRGDLLIFTAGGEWAAKAGAKTDVFTPSSIVITPSGYRGSSDLPPLDVGNATLFVQRDGRTVRSLGYSLEMDNYTSSDLSILAEHLFRDTTVQRWAYQQAPWSIVWVVLDDGRLLALTLNQEHQVSGWGRHDLSQSNVVDVCSIPGAGQDDVYFAFSRLGGGVVVERLGRQNDSAGELEWKDSGLHPVHSTVELLEWEQQVNGTLQGRHKGILVATIRMLRKAEIWVGVMTENNQKLDCVRFSPEASPYIADARVELPGGMGRQCRMRVEHRRPEPLTILGIFPEVDVHD